MGHDTIGRVNEFGVICECQSDCSYDCKGHSGGCGCDYCGDAYQDFLADDYE